MSSSSWEDREVLQEVWGGRVPAVFRLSEADQRPEQEAEPCCLLLPRMSYLPLATDKVRRHFAGGGDQQQRHLKLGGHVGFDSLPDQLVNKSVQSGFSFNILCIGIVE